MLFERRTIMEKLKMVTIMFLFAFGLFSTAAAAKPASVMLREGLYAEEVEGNIDAAIKIYEQIVQDKSASRDNVAQALYRQGMCYMKKKDDSGARAAFGKLVAEYSDQTEMVEKVKPLLDDLMNYDPADLMPPQTLMYMELGSPGKQVETILNMLKGTPYENPLAAVYQSAQVGDQNVQKTPGDFVGALLNPSMIAEFKKIKGMAVGVTAVRENNPPVIVVLYPGKSDALRGIILMALGMAGQRSEPIEGMETLNIQNSASAAYDDKVIIIAQPAEQLNWCIKQYKGITSEPTLASSNKSFAKVSKKTRQDNALTVWANVDEAYAGILKQFPAGQSPPQVLVANGIADFNNIDDLIMYVSVEESGLTYKADVSFKDGHHCLAYDMIRTPNLSKAAFGAVSSDAVALVSLALGQADGAQAKAVSEKIQHVTGLDIGREIFANIEQVTLFAVPSDANFTSDVPFLPNIGLAVTSHNPQQTRQILTTLLGTANLIAGGQQASQADISSDQYQIDIVGGQKLYCYMDQTNRTTVLSLNKNITDASIAALKKHESACTAGPLKDSISKLSPSTSKLVLVNVGGAVRIAAPAIIGSLKDSDREKIRQALDQLAQSYRQTTIEIRTDEQLNDFTLCAAVTGLPPLNEVFGPVTEISRVMSEAKAKTAVVASAIAITLDKAPKAPTIDGTVDDIWSDIQKHSIANALYSPVSSANDLSADYKAMWDQENLYLLVDVRDDVLKNDSAEHYNDDSVEVFIDADNSKSSEYGENDHSYYFKWDRTNPTMGEQGQPYLKGDVKFALVTTDNGYRLEVAFPWSTLGTKPFAGAKIGLDVHVNDDDDGAERDTKITWWGKEDNAWQSPRVFGTAELAGLIGWWKFDESEGSAAADSSGNGNDGSLQGNPVWRPNGGKLAGALEFDGDGDYVKIGNESSFDITGQITISAWVNINSVPAEWTAIVSKGDSAWRLSTEFAQNGFHFGVSGNTYLNGQARVSSNQWHHVVGVYDGSQMRTYIDGKLDVAKAWDQGIASNDYPVYIGGNAEQTGRFWHGLIDDVRIYNYALKEADIIALYNEGVRK
jgi:hypothetical protein